jgi:serine/threonine-protein kinase RsbT
MLVEERRAVGDRFDGEVLIETEEDIVRARTMARDAASVLGFGLTDVTRIVTATSELARNIYRFAGGGIVKWRSVYNSGKAGIELLFEDRGPGIPDIDKAMEPGYSTVGGLGMGLPGSKRLMDEMSVRSVVGEGTRVMVRKWTRE